ncbi:hypothetical protein OROGR_014712 [Orobanche gracilis]
MMQRWCSTLRLLAPLRSLPKPHHHTHSIIPGRLLHTSSNILYRPHVFAYSLFSPSYEILLYAPPIPRICSSPIYLTQVRHITAKQRKRKLNSRRPMTPVISKVKKIKIKGYSSFEGRFRIMHDGQIRRWKAGKRHNAHSKSKSSKSRLRKPGIVALAYAKVLKKLNFRA